MLCLIESSISWSMWLRKWLELLPTPLQQSNMLDKRSELNKFLFNYYIFLYQNGHFWLTRTFTKNFWSKVKPFRKLIYRNCLLLGEHLLKCSSYFHKDSFAMLQSWHSNSSINGVVVACIVAIINIMHCLFLLLPLSLSPFHYH